MRIGFGYDVHQLKEGRELWLGGVMIPHSKGALGHSDADVVLHAICDALLGAAAMGDIGMHFPDSNPEWKDIDSKILLKKVNMMISEAGYAIGNIDTTLVLQVPKVASYIQKMRESVASVLMLNIDQVSIKATTTERLGFVGKEEGIASYAVVMLVKE